MGIWVYIMKRNEASALDRSSHSRFDMFRLSVTLAAMLVACQSVICYESVYDIIERRNQRFLREPGHGYPESRGLHFDRYPNFNAKSATTRSPIRYDWFSLHGNGYDNIGNGNIRATDRLHFIPEDVPHHRMYRAGFNDVYRREFPVFHDKYYYLRPHHEDRGFDLDIKNSGRVYEEKGNSDVYRIDNAVANNEGNKQRNLIENFRDDKLSTLSDATRRENFGETSHTDTTNENKSTIRSNRVSKKGHVTKGFSTHHHKDETGNTTTFYDEFSDHGGQDDYRDVADGFGTKTTAEHFANVEDGKFFNENGGHSGNYGTGSIVDTRKTEKNHILKDNRYDRDERFRLEGGKDRFGSLRNPYDGGYAPHHLHFSHYNH